MQSFYFSNLFNALQPSISHGKSFAYTHIWNGFPFFFFLHSLWHQITSSPGISLKPSCLLLTHPLLSLSLWHSNIYLHLHCFQILASFSYVYSFFTYYLCLSECIQPYVPPPPPPTPLKIL